MDDPRERLEYIGGMAEEMAQLARDLGRPRLGELLSMAAAVAVMDLRARRMETGPGDTAH